MKLESVGFRMNNLTSFCANNDNFDSSENKTKSAQNNSFDVYISPEAYYSMFAKGVINKMDDSNILPVADKAEESSSTTIPLLDEPESPSDDEFMVDMTLFSLKAAASMMPGPIHPGVKVPTFVKFEYKNYISNLENLIQKGKELIAELDLDLLVDDSEYDLEDGFSLDPETIAKRALFMMPNIVKKQEKLLEFFRTTKAQELQQTLEEVSNATNAMFYNVIMHGLDGNAKAVVEDLTYNLELCNKPEIVDNYDGTLTYSYLDMLGNQFEIVKKNNGDYVSASAKNANKTKVYDVEFNYNGSIGKLDYCNSIDNSIVSIMQKGKLTTVRQILDSLVTERTFVKTPDGKLKQTSIRIYAK